jgi:hypothetical protein
VPHGCRKRGTYLEEYFCFVKIWTKLSWRSLQRWIEIVRCHRGCFRIIRARQLRGHASSVGYLFRSSRGKTTTERAGNEPHEFWRSGRRSAGGGPSFSSSSDSSMRSGCCRWAVVYWYEWYDCYGWWLIVIFFLILFWCSLLFQC